MDKDKLKMIMELMEELTNEMELGEDDFSERLGRKKPEPEVSVMIESEEELPLDEEDLEGEAHEQDEELEEMIEESPEDKLKSRILKMRG